MKRQSIVFLVLGAIGCSNGGGPPNDRPLELRLPDFNGVSSICEEDEKRFLSGGDVNAVVERIVIGEVSSIEFLEIEDGIDCTRSSHTWTLRVGVQTTQALKGEGGEIMVNMQPKFLGWASEPMRRTDSTWLPEWPDSPKIEVSDELGWSNETGLQVGQVVALFLKETDGVLHTGRMPWGEYSEGRIIFPINEVGGCKYLPKSWHDGVTLAELEADLRSDLVAENDFIRQDMVDKRPSLKSYCNQVDVPVPGDDMGGI